MGLAEITPKYALECAEFTTLAMSVCEELVAQSKSDDTVAKLSEAGELQGLLDAGAYVAVGADGSALSADELKSKMASFDDEAAKSAEAVLGRKAAYDKLLHSHILSQPGERHLLANSRQTATLGSGLAKPNSAPRTFSRPAQNTSA